DLLEVGIDRHARQCGPAHDPDGTARGTRRRPLADTDATFIAPLRRVRHRAHATGSVVTSRNGNVTCRPQTLAGSRVGQSIGRNDGVSTSLSRRPARSHAALTPSQAQSTQYRPASDFDQIPQIMRGTKKHTTM